MPVSHALLTAKRAVVRTGLALRQRRLGHRIDGRPRTVTAMLRVRNEEQFLDAAVRSIADVIDAVVIVDNASTDGTPAVVERLAADLPHVRVYDYPHAVYRVGAEHVAARRAADPDDPRTLANFYNFCLDRCSSTFVLKWDGDMVATDAGRARLAAWGADRALVWRFHGTNVFPDLDHRLASPPVPEDLAADPTLPGASMLGNLALTVAEPRLFPRLEARYVDSRSWETLASPLLDGGYPERRTVSTPESCYLHLKYCKTDPHSNQSAEFAETVRNQVECGDPLTADERAALRWLGR